ncbi:MAG: aminotransferase class I/II-fold pyridoxal phosphate-dependent enzyme [Rhodospirillaceae bacterium]|nr:aminotransferase class I/II-fold pyridoxal phosphate-dependent enzyme [Rhodospirillaceae bacterium]
MMQATVARTGALYTATAKCRICGNAGLIPILDLGMQTLAGYFPQAGEPDPPVAPLRLMICDAGAAPDACGLVQMGHTYELSLMQGGIQGYRSSINGTMVAHLHTVADRVRALAGLKPGDWVLEIGSNDGTVQNHLAGRGLNLVAVDPAARQFAANYPKDTRLVADFFSRAAVEAAAPGRTFRAILSMNMFYDLDAPFAVMNEAKGLLASDGVWCFEQAYLPAMFEAMCYDTICHEHLCYYALSQMQWMARRAGLRLIDVEMSDINGGSFAVFVCHDAAPYVSNTVKLERILAGESRMNLTSAGKWQNFGRNVRHHRARIRGFFEDARARGDLVLGLGASSKGNVILQYAGIDGDLMPAIAERDSRKIGLRTPRTNIPIVSEDAARAMNPRGFFVFPWHFHDEIVRREKPFLEGGGRLVFPLPQFEVVGARGDAAAKTIPWAAPMLFGDERAAIAEALDSTMISGGAAVDECEARFAEMHGGGVSAITCTNGTSAIQLAYLALGIGPGDEVIVPGWGFLAAANMVRAVGATPVFADIDDREWLIDPNDVKAKITPRTKAIVAVHTYGNVCDVAALSKIAQDAGIFLIEDCAESLGSFRAGRMCGTVGDIATFSFQATKLITCGEGGMILVRSPAVADKARLIRSHAMRGKRRYWHYDIGHNMRLPNILAAMLCAQLGHWTEIKAERQRLWDGYRSRLQHVNAITFQHFDPAVSPVVWAVGLRLRGLDEAARDRLMDMMEDAGIECRPGFYPPSAQPIYGPSPLVVSDVVAAQIVVPPINPALSEEDLDLICNTFITALGKVHG